CPFANSAAGRRSTTTALRRLISCVASAADRPPRPRRATTRHRSNVPERRAIAIRTRLTESGQNVTDNPPEKRGKRRKRTGKQRAKKKRGQPRHYKIITCPDGDARILAARALALPLPYYRPATHMHKLVLIRHGESTWNKENRFTGWVDVDLTEQGVREARQ